MKEEKLNGIVLASNPYRWTSIPAERKLSKEEAETLIDIVKDESYLTSCRICYYDAESDSILQINALSALERLGYTNNGSGMYTKANGITFYREKGISLSGISLISGNHYGNITEILDNFKRFDEFCDYAHEKIGFLEAISILPLLGLPILARSKIKHQLAMDLSKDFACYKYGKDAINQLQSEYMYMQSKIPASNESLQLKFQPKPITERIISPEFRVKKDYLDDIIKIFAKCPLPLYPIYKK